MYFWQTWGFLGWMGLAPGDKPSPFPCPRTSVRCDCRAMSAIPGYDTALNAATLSMDSSTTLKFPWKKTKLMQNIFGNVNEQALKRPRLPLVAGPPEHSNASSSSVPLEAKCELQLRIPRVRLTTSHLRSAEPEGERQRALEAWLQISKLDLEQSTTGRQIMRILGSGSTLADETAEVSLTISMAARGKSANTLVQRAASLSQYLT